LPHIDIRILGCGPSSGVKLNFWKAIFRAWFYFRQGYSLYLAFLLGFASNVVVIYKLAIVDNNYLHPIFPNLGVFAVVGVLVAAPVGILAGLYHMKRTGAFAADASIGTEANPYVYKAVPGKEREVFLPLWVLTARTLARVLDQQKAMTAEEKKDLEEILRKANALLEGEYVGLPKHLGIRNFPVTEGDK
jgi:hypothetical protein